MKTLSYTKKDKKTQAKGIDLALFQLGIKVATLVKKRPNQMAI